ncbi:hypothetical protein EMIHUDRAFT_366984 [Emiliania huxleyi CCMP1516]|uniref:Uncharacterized protein n=2 Tax=Emiliania huxleyi TaxID=2903 RepID=A0A0D3JS17_EMIH1|nr:hypothetical protein EMIHUDRAFT_366984 [Emiliania huxleyi CCMP1516]EOD26302.1 hypothetical protein EMIHUDRAFT_366984 [Emiliania huxleyi CCMP1516]|eukprot:XP_005778731.1 hypothetical protein EMIHUDRAFT_366984 [Emiliania huxleyi CCMP1516]
MRGVSSSSRRTPPPTRERPPCRPTAAPWQAPPSSSLLDAEATGVCCRALTRVEL